MPMICFCQEICAASQDIALYTFKKLALSPPATIVPRLSRNAM